MRLVLEQGDALGHPVALTDEHLAQLRVGIGDTISCGWLRHGSMPPMMRVGMPEPSRPRIFFTRSTRYEDGVDTFVDEVVPTPQKRGIYPTEYLGTTLRANLGVPHQYGLNPRITGAE